MSKGINLSPKHGVNPSMIECAFCGKEKGIALLGKLPKDAEAPRKILVDYEPCDECKSKFEQGVAIIEVTTSPNFTNQPPIQKEAYPTGAIVVVKPEALNGDFKRGMRVLMIQEEFRKIFEGS